MPRIGKHGRSTPARRIGWDSCCFIEWIKGGQGCSQEAWQAMEEIVSGIYAGKVILVTSAITHVELYQGRMDQEGKRRFNSIFDHPNLQVVSVDRKIAERARIIRESCEAKGRKIKTPDAIQLATGIIYRIAEFHTFDGKLQKLSGDVSGSILTITPPVPSPSPDWLGPTGIGPHSPQKPQQENLLFESQDPGDRPPADPPVE